MRFILVLVVCSAFVKPTTKPKKVVEISSTVNTISKEKQQILQFQMLRSSNRVELFNAISLLIKTKVSAKTGFSTKKDVIELLGEPNVKIKNSQFVYTLNPKTGCIAIIEFDDNGFANCSVLKSCNQ